MRIFLALIALKSRCPHSFFHLNSISGYTDLRLIMKITYQKFINLISFLENNNWLSDVC